jgi:hypothetical protein
MFTLEFYVSDETAEDTNYALDLTTSETQQLKSILNAQLSLLERSRDAYKEIAVLCKFHKDKEGVEFYWKQHQNCTKQINKLAKIQAKIKRSL